MDPNQTKHQDRSTANKPQDPNKQREEKPKMPGQGERRDPNKSDDPAAIPENNQPYDDKGRPAGQKGGQNRPYPDEQDPENPGVDTLKPGR
jgi:hypothetical protein